LEGPDSHYSKDNQEDTVANNLEVMTNLFMKISATLDNNSNKTLVDTVDMMNQSMRTSIFQEEINNSKRNQFMKTLTTSVKLLLVIYCKVLLLCFRPLNFLHYQATQG
jgi:hypothetical protein